VDATAYITTYARMVALARAMQATDVEGVVAALEQLTVAGPGYDDEKVKARAQTNLAVADAVARAALEFKRAVTRVLPVAEVRVL
jgi:predicted negative regulator of RcsB-dependent stress response